MRVEIPGIAGNLGECPFCGGTFTMEILLGKLVRMIHVEGFSCDLPMHEECVEKLKLITDGDWRKLPEGPLRAEFQQADAELVARRAVGEQAGGAKL